MTNALSLRDPERKFLAALRAATFDTRALPAAAEAIGSIAYGVRANGGADLVLRTAMAPAGASC